MPFGDKLREMQCHGQNIRKIILQQSKRAHVGHIGCSLSIADIIGVLYKDVIRVPDASDPDRDRFVLSKGHAALALYAALALKGLIPAEQLDTFCADNSLLGVHPEYVLPGVDFSTGSLGQGLSMGAGAAMAARLQGSSRQVYVVLSDGECNEGSVWEGVMFAAHHRLANLTAIIDLNGQQAFGYTKDVMDLNDMTGRWRAFGWDAVEVDGHDTEALRSAILDNRVDAPRAVIARTVFGKGVSFMERQIKWHYMPLTDAEYEQALAEVG
jgi:transketolase